MSALPLFTALPPAQASAALEKSITTPNPPSTLASKESGDDFSDSGIVLETPMQGSTDSDAAHSFWDTLQQQAASVTPDLGRNVSASSNAMPDLVSENSSVPEDINVDAIQVQGPSPLIEQTVSEQGLIAPWSMAAIQATANEGGAIVGNSAMDQILSQRSAQPQVQAQAGVLSSIELQSKSILDAPLTQGVAAPVMAEAAAQPMIGQLVQSTSSESNNILRREGSSLSQGVTLDESLMMDEPINIHEKPITLIMPEVLTSQAATQATNATQDLTLMETVGELDAFQVTTGQNTKDLSQSVSSKVLDSATQMADKVLAGQAKIDVPPSSPKFTEQVAQRIGIMSSEQLQTARIQLDPPELGSLEIKIRVQQDQVSVSFTSGHQVVRDALEAQSPRLREMLEQQGVELTDVNVSDQQQPGSEGNTEGSQGEGAEDWVDDEMREETLVTEVQSDSLVDYFA